MRWFSRSLSPRGTSPHPAPAGCGFEILVQVQRRELVGHFGGQVRAGARCRKLRTRWWPQVGWPLRGSMTSALIIFRPMSLRICSSSASRVLLARSFGIKIVALDDAEQRLGRHDALADHLDALIRVGGDGGAHQLLRHLLLLDEDRAGRAVMCGGSRMVRSRVNSQTELKIPINHGRRYFAAASSAGNEDGLSVSAFNDSPLAQ